LECLQFPEFIINYSRNKFRSEEAVLVSLFRLHYPTEESSLAFVEVFGYKYHKVSKAFNAFLNFMTTHWGYLLLDNMNYWLDKLPDCAEKIREKLGELDCPFDEGDFDVFGFIDNTMNATCRPGGGPKRDGTRAPRNDPTIQRAFYNGWKKLHGYKWQTIDLPNGMNFHVWGPVSVRHNDLYTLSHSNVNDLLRDVQLGRDRQYKIYGDSAYYPDTHMRCRHDYDDLTYREIKENKAMPSCRETSNGTMVILENISLALIIKMV